MSWSSWSSRLNVQSIVSQGLEQVSKLKEDVEKQFDQVVASSSTQPPGSRSRTSATQEAVSSPPAVAVNEALLKEIESIPPPLLPPPPRSVDGKTSAALLASLGIAKSASNGTASPSSAPNSTTSKSSASDFFGSYLQENAKNGTASPPAPPASGKEKNEFAPALFSEPADAVVIEGSLNNESLEHDELEAKQDRGIEESPSVDDGVEGDKYTESADDDQDVEELEERVNVDSEDQLEQKVARAEPNPVATAAAEEAILTNHRDENASTESEGQIDSQSDETPQHRPSSEASLEAKVEAINGDHDRIRSLEQQLNQRETQLLSTSAVIQELHDELDKTCQREVAAVERNRFLTEQLELLRQEVLRLNRVVTHQQQQSVSQTEVDALQQAVAEKDAKLQALLDEGQALSVKQSQLEQRLRQLRREKNEEEEQKLKLQAQSDTLAIQVQEFTTKWKESEAEKKRLTVELRSTQQTLESIAKQLKAAQDEVSEANGSLAAVTAELESARDENASLRDELDELQHTSNAHATLSVEKREMETTIQFLQQRAYDLEADAQRRDETARMEITDLKRKWQDALQRVESMGQSVAEATQPLLRQIHALQEDQRARQETWTATEATLRQRIHDASVQRKAMETDRLAVEQQLHELRVQCDDLQTELLRKQVEVTRERERVDTALQKERDTRSKCDALQLERDELSLKLQDALHARHALLTRSESMKREEDGKSQEELASLTAQVEELRSVEQKLRHDLDWHQKELQRMKASTSSPRLPARQQRRSFDEDWAGSGNSSPQMLPLAPGSGSQSQASILQRTLDATADDSRLSSTSVLGMSQLQQRLRLREGENRLLRQQLQAIEDKQKQTTEEIVRLSTRNALLESSATQFEATQQELEQLKQKQHVLLELFGEKEEQVEELQAEVKELKAFYRKQLDTLARQHQ